MPPSYTPPRRQGTVIPTREHKNPELLRGRLGLLGDKTDFVVIAKHLND